MPRQGQGRDGPNRAAMSKSPISEEQYTRIEDYLTGRMQGAARVHFEAEMKENPGLKAAMEDYQEIIVALRTVEGERVMRELMQEWAREMSTAPEEKPIPAGENSTAQEQPPHSPGKDQEARISPPINRPRRKFLPGWTILAIPLAAGLALAIWVGVKHFSARQDIDPFEKYFKIDPRAPYNLGQDADEARQLAMGAYAHEEFREADSLFRRARAISPNDDTLRYFHGITLLALGAAFEANVELLPLCEGNSSFRDMARWYQALAILKLGDDDAAVPELQAISRESGHPMQQQAAELLEEITRP